MFETYALAGLSLAIVLYIQARLAARIIRYNREDGRGRRDRASQRGV